jgi:aminobenzoyl-glutamate utilization protein B
MKGFALPEYTAEEYEFAEKLTETYKDIKPALPGCFTNDSAELKGAIKELSDDGKAVINNFIMPYYHSDKALAGSTDVGDTSQRTPTAQISTVCWTSGSPGHSWQNVALGKSSIAHKGMLYAGKVLAASAVDLLENESLRAAAMAEFKESTKNGIESPIEQSFKK